MNVDGVRSCSVSPHLSGDRLATRQCKSSMEGQFEEPGVNGDECDIPAVDRVTPARINRHVAALGYRIES